MRFREISHNTVVRWNSLLWDHLMELPDGQLWEGEPQGCCFTVTAILHTGISAEEEEGILELDCAKGCGQHGNLTITEGEYEEYSTLLGGDLLEEVWLGDIEGALLEGEEVPEKLDINAEVADLVDRLLRGEVS